jgi:hypothetical protein
MILEKQDSLLNKIKVKELQFVSSVKIRCVKVFHLIGRVFHNLRYQFPEAYGPDAWAMYLFCL